MQARGPLMIEHRLIERMLAVVRRTLAATKASGGIDPGTVDAFVDFIRFYADQTHHGKEEDILFRELAKKSLSGNDRATMDELIREHAYGRETTAALVAANLRYRNGETSALREVTTHLGTQGDFYPQHIEKEDKVFFPASRAYLSEEEEQAMLAEFWEFDRKMIHQKYQAVVAGIEAQQS
jgi:hemerythrin-like domain-containing protein